MKFIALKTKDGELKGEIAFYCRSLHVSRQGFYQYLENKDRPWKYQPLADAMKDILEEDECNDTYGRIRMYQALLLKQPEHVNIPSERTVYRIMEEIGLSHHPRRKPNGITKADREARKSEDLLKRDFRAEEPLTKYVTDITEIKARDGKLYVSAIFDCFDSSVIGLAMDTNMKAPLCAPTLEHAAKAYPCIRGAMIHRDRGSQYTSQLYRDAVQQYDIRQSMNSASGRCHDNARCESMWARMKSELLYDRYDTEKMTTDELKTLIWRYFISYWNNRRICSANGGLPPIVKRQQYYDSLKEAAYDKPITVSDLSKAIGIPAAYIEPIIKKLVDGELMVQMDSGKVYTDFIITRPQNSLNNFKPQLEFTHKHFETIWSINENISDKISKMSFVKEMAAEDRTKLDRYAVLKALQDFGHFGTGKIEAPKFPKRKDGSWWFAQAIVFDAGYNMKNIMQPPNMQYMAAIAQRKLYP